MFVSTVVHAEEVSNQHVPFTTVHCRTRALLSHASLGFRTGSMLGSSHQSFLVASGNRCFFPSCHCHSQLSSRWMQVLRGTLLVCRCQAIPQGVQCPALPQYSRVLFTILQQQNGPSHTEIPLTQTATNCAKPKGCSEKGEPRTPVFPWRYFKLDSSTCLSAFQSGYGHRTPTNATHS